MQKLVRGMALSSLIPGVFAGTQVENFSWASQPISTSNIQVATVNPFNPANGTLTGVFISLSGSAVGSASVLNQGPGASSVSVGLKSTTGHHVVFQNPGVADIVNVINVTSASVLINQGQTLPVGPISAPIPGTADGGLVGWSAGAIPIFIRFNGILNVDTSPLVTFTASPSITSSGSGRVTYTYSDVRVPEAETYVAGLALAGLVGYGFYRRSLKN